MKKISTKGLATSVSAVALIVAGPAFAQDQAAEQATGVVTDAPADETLPETNADGSENEGAIVVTGSRIKRKTYESISPIQVLTTEAAQDAGTFNATDLLQRSEVAAGTQIDSTFGGYVLDNGPGSETIDLRGLGANRTLVLINGRRMAPAGVEGAPQTASINTIPASLVSRYDLLTDGASSVYGSDAVAGVVNVVLRKDIEGFEIHADGDYNPDGGDTDYTVSGAWGFKNDRATFGIGAEYAFKDAVRLRDRDFLAGCDTNYEITNTGEIRTVGIADNAVVRNRTPGVTVSESPCKVTGISGRIFIPYTFLGSVYYTPGPGNTTIPGFNESTNAFGRDLDTNGDGIRDVDFQDVNTNAKNLDQVLIPQQKRYNLMAYGEYALESEINLTPFFEANYSRAETYADNLGAYQIFPYVPDNNPFNPCNQYSNPDGVDCPQADNNTQGGPFNPYVGAPLPVSPIVAIRGDRANTDVVLETYRGVLGMRGDMPFVAPSWGFELAGTYTHSKGVSIRRGIREDKLAFALGIDPTADFDGDGIADNDGDGIADDYNSDEAFPLTLDPCDASALANPELAAPDLLQGCVPINLFAPSVLGSAIGDFATAAERAYAFGERRFDTTYDQLVLSGVASGNLFTLPGGDAGISLGFEVRHDAIDSSPDLVASNGLFIAFFQDLGAKGSKLTRELFGEVELPLLADRPFFEELSLNVAGRLTNDEFYGTNETYALKAGWRPIQQLLLKATYGTSFRAPSLRENFLAGQSGFSTVFDPCAVPTEAYNPLAGGYNPDADNREPAVFANCIREGRDPLTVGLDPNGLNTIQTSSAEVTTGGSFDIDPETSRSMTFGAGFQETLAGVRVALNVNYFDVRVRGAIVEPSTQFIVNDCFTRQDGIRSQFCDRIEYGTLPDQRDLVVAVNSGFINLNEETVRGIDFNTNFEVDVPAFGSEVKLAANLRANHLLERSTLFIDDDGVEDLDEDTGDFGYAKWKGSGIFSAEVGKWKWTWETRYIGDVAQDPDGVDPFSDAYGRGPDGAPTGVTGDTCLGNGSGSYNASTGTFTPNGRVPGDNVFCRDVGFADDYFVHSTSIRYDAGDWDARLGVRNVFDRAPPKVDTSEVTGIANTPIGAGYDLNGREVFAAVNFRF